MSAVRHLASYKHWSILSDVSLTNTSEMLGSARPTKQWSAKSAIQNSFEPHHPLLVFIAFVDASNGFGKLPVQERGGNANIVTPNQKEGKVGRRKYGVTYLM